MQNIPAISQHQPSNWLLRHDNLQQEAQRQISYQQKSINDLRFKVKGVKKPT